MAEPKTPPQRRLRDVSPIQVELNRDLHALLRPIDASDTERAKRAYEHLSPESRRNRFWTTAKSLDHQLAARLTNTDDSEHIAWMALADCNDDSFPGYAAASLWRDPDCPEEAEFAMTVIDQWQRHGFGSLLFSVLWQEGWSLGIRRFTGFARLGNLAMCRWWQAIGGEIHTTRNQHELAYDLSAPDAYVNEIGFDLHATEHQVEVANWLSHWQKVLSAPPAI